MVRFMNVQNTTRRAAAQGCRAFISGTIEYLQQDFRRLPAFDKKRAASHSPLGVIELMPTSDGETHGFPRVNGHPSDPGNGFHPELRTAPLGIGLIAATSVDDTVNQHGHQGAPPTTPSSSSTWSAEPLRRTDSGLPVDRI